MRFCCPMCQGRCAVHRVQQVSATVRMAYLQCRDPLCGWSGTGHAAVDRTILPGLAPDPAVQLDVPAVLIDRYIADLLSAPH